MDEKSFKSIDAEVYVTTPRADHDHFVRGKEGDWTSYKAVRALLKELGFTFHDDPSIHKGYKTLARTNHGGSKGDVHFHSELGPVGFSYHFYEDVPRDNPNGGRYTHAKMQKAPYLWVKRVELLQKKIGSLLVTLGFEDRTPPRHELALDQVMEIRKHDQKDHPSSFRPTFNGYGDEDADGVRMQDGDLRYFRTRSGRLHRGIVYRPLGNVWHVITSKTERDHAANFELFSLKSDTPRKVQIEPLVKMARALERAVRAQRFERAAAIRDALERVAPNRPLRAGQRVCVSHPNYHGEGVVEYVDAPFYVGVKLSNGNTWRYEMATVSQAPAPAHHR